MLQQEFEQLTRVKVSAKYFNEVLHPEYMESDKEKAEFCKAWKRNGGLQKAYNYEVNRREAFVHGIVEIIYSAASTEALENETKNLKSNVSWCDFFDGAIWSKMAILKAIKEAQ